MHSDEDDSRPDVNLQKARPVSSSPSLLGGPEPHPRASPDELREEAEGDEQHGHVPVGRSACIRPQGPASELRLLHLACLFLFYLLTSLMHRLWPGTWAPASLRNAGLRFSTAEGLRLAFSSLQVKL